MKKMRDLHRKVDENVVIYENVKIGKNVTIGRGTIIYENVEIGDNTYIGPDCILGEPVSTFYSSPENYENPPLFIGPGSIIRSHTIIYAGCSFKERLETGHRVTIRERTVAGINLRVGTLSDIQGYVNIGDYCRFHSNVHIGQKSTIKNYVWIFPYVVLTNDPHPPSDTCTMGPTIEDYAVIGTMSVILPALKIGHDAVVGAGSVVTKDVEPETVVYGVPAKPACSIHEIRCKHGKLEKVYPWRSHFKRGFPWQ